MSIRTHFFLIALAGSLFYYHLTFGYSLGFFCTWSAILMLINHALDVVVDSPRLTRIKRLAFVVFCLSFFIRLTIVPSISTAPNHWEELAKSFFQVLPTCILIWLPVSRSLPQTERDEFEKL